MRRLVIVVLTLMFLGTGIGQPAEPKEQGGSPTPVLEDQPQAALVFRKNGTQARVKLIRLTPEEVHYSLTDSDSVLKYTAKGGYIRGIQTAAGDCYAINPNTGGYDRYDPITQSWGVLRKAEKARKDAEEAKRQAEIARAEAEKIKLETERTKKEAEEKARLEAEKAQQEAERAKREAEQARQEAEKAKQEAEQAKSDSKSAVDFPDSATPRSKGSDDPTLQPNSPVRRKATQPDQNSPPGLLEQVAKTLGGIGMVVGLIAFAVVGYGFATKCPQCQKWFARKLEETVILSRRGAYRTVTREDKHRNSKWEVVGTTQRQEQVHVTQATCRDHYCCRNCNHKWTADYIKEYEG